MTSHDYEHTFRHLHLVSSCYIASERLRKLGNEVRGCVSVFSLIGVFISDNHLPTLALLMFFFTPLANSEFKSVNICAYNITHS